MAEAQYLCMEHPLTEDDSLEGKVIGHQLLFSMDFPDRLKKTRFVPVIKGDEDATVKSFEKKYGVKCVWQEVGSGKHPKWLAWLIVE